MNNFEGEQFLHGMDSTLHTSVPVEHSQSQRPPSERSQRPREKISSWLRVIERTHGHDDPIVQERIKASYHKRYVIKPGNFPDAYFTRQQENARRQGLGDIEITEEMRSEQIGMAIENQKRSLDIWIDYLLSSDSSYMPTWVKYWVFTGMVKLGGYDKEKRVFHPRRIHTVSAFPELNREALALAVELIQTKVREPEIQGERDRILASSNFGKYYAYAIDKVIPTGDNSNELLNTEGEWVKWKQGSDYGQLVDSLRGMGTGWCTANDVVARKQLESGDFHIYYTKDKEGQLTMPRIAIRMKGGHIAEIRGIDNDQNIDPYILGVLDEKLEEFGEEGELYKEKVSDMRLLTSISDKVDNGEPLSIEELRFLYEIDRQIIGFGYVKDPRIFEIIERRNIREDLSLIFGCREDQISLTAEEAISGDIRYHHGELYLGNLESAEGLQLPEIVGGSLDLRNLISAEGVQLPESVGGDLDLGNLESAEGLQLPESVEGGLYLSSLESAEGLQLPESVGGGLYFGNLSSAKGLQLPERVVGNLDFGNLESVEGLQLPESVGGGLYFGNLSSAKGLQLPEHVGGNLSLGNLESAEGLQLPESVGWNLELSNLESAEGLQLPEIVGGELNLSNLRSAEGLRLPESVGGGLDLGSLESAEGLQLPKHVGGDLNLGNLESAEGLQLPEHVGRNLDLRHLRSAKGVRFPKNVGWNLGLGSLESAEGVQLPESVGWNLDLRHLRSAKEVRFPGNVGGNLNLSRLESAEGLRFPEHVGGSIYLFSLKSTEGLNLLRIRKGEFALVN